MIKIVLTGPESTGKTSLARLLASEYKVLWVNEFARSFLEKRQNIYNYDDLFSIAESQCILEDSIADLMSEKSPLFCDTDLITLQIWAEYRFGKCPISFGQEIYSRHYDLYFLCDIDVAWTSDAQRQNKDDRLELFQYYENLLKYYNKEYVIINGSESQRVTKVKEILAQRFGLKSKI